MQGSRFLRFEKQREKCHPNSKYKFKRGQTVACKQRRRVIESAFKMHASKLKQGIQAATKNEIEIYIEVKDRQ